MALSIINWNINENRPWFVRLSDTGTAVRVDLYLTQASAAAQTNRQASGISAGYGAELLITLTNDSGAAVPVSLFRDEYSWHLIVSGQNGDTTKTYRIKEFIEADEISHAIYRNSSLIASRATAEINAHTHAAIIRNITLGAHITSLDVGQIAQLNSDRHGVNDLSQITEIEIIGTPDRLINTIETRKYIGLKR